MKHGLFEITSFQNLVSKNLVLVSSVKILATQFRPSMCDRTFHNDGLLEVASHFLALIGTICSYTAVILLFYIVFSRIFISSCLVMFFLLLGKSYTLVSYENSISVVLVQY